jgi:hypothetical protein
MSFSTGVLVFICAACWIAVVMARSGILRGKGGVRDPRGTRVLREALDKRRDVPDVGDVRAVRDVRRIGIVRPFKGMRGKRNTRV